MEAVALVELARQARGETLRLLAAAPEKWLTWAPEGTSNHILWHAGHALWVQDVLFVECVTGRTELPAGWAETFGADCRPVSLSNQLKAWPAREEISQRLTAQLTRFIGLLKPLTAGQLAAPPATGGESLVSSLIHGWHDEAKHQGEMQLLLKLQRALNR
jgi:hypothetical protein